jgi:hypothetical protein
MAPNRTFQLIDVEPDANSEVDTKPAETRSAEARAKLVIATRHEITAAGIETVLHTAGHCVAARCSCEARFVMQK